MTRRERATAHKDEREPPGSNSSPSMPGAPSEGAASWSPAAHPSVRSCRRARSEGVQIEAERVGEQSPRLAVSEAQVRRPHLHQLAPHAQGACLVEPAVR
jgi:hypothetical protein